MTPYLAPHSCHLQEVTYPVVTPEVAFTGDTAAGVFSSPGFEDALAAKLLIIESTFLCDDVSLDHAKVLLGSLSCYMLPIMIAMVH